MRWLRTKRGTWPSGDSAALRQHLRPAVPLVIRVDAGFLVAAAVERHQHAGGVEALQQLAQQLQAAVDHAGGPALGAPLVPLRVPRAVRQIIAVDQEQQLRHP